MRKKELCTLLSCSRMTLHRWTVAGTAPAFTRLNARKIVYDRAVVQAWIAARNGSPAEAP